MTQPTPITTTPCLPPAVSTPDRAHARDIVQTTQNRRAQMARSHLWPSPPLRRAALASRQLPDQPSQWSERPPAAVAVAASQRLVRLAVALSARAALSTRQEVYPRGMPAEQAIRLALSSLIGPAMLTRDQIWDRVRSRYPEAVALPDRPALDSLLRTTPGAGA